MLEPGVEQLPALREILPHGGHVLLLHQVLAHDEEETCCRLEVGAQPWLRREDGSVPAWVGLEYMAQCSAAHNGYRAWIEGSSTCLGVLAAARHVRFRRAVFDPGEILRVRARRVRGRQGLGAFVFACEIRAERAGSEGPLLAEGVLTVALIRGSTP